ncbi:MAG: DNA polymerase III subunit beta [Candidatus Spechtbacteria bacterium SB0662_bin_43]|uniref:DNA polymerase III subunit beta n=1 Tax=Candidatus Spechtbacteria bacterium SB0662_bin_43 TaxID=2604897 RepID=A0A845DAI6_9BACT|nr:DNA polymerase III subunit beta [Candidatus Spechtbacteria bacterium SB0662_bin_43]
MNFSLKKEIVTKIIGMVEPALSRNSSLPHLSHIFIEGGDNTISISTTDLDVSILLSIPTKTKNKKKESLLVDPRVLSGVVSHALSPVVDIQKKGTVLEVKQKNYKSEIQTMDSDEFPAISESQSKDSVCIPSSVFLLALSQVVNSTSSMETKPELTGMLLHITNNDITLTTTDGFRLSEKKIFQKNVIKEEIKQIIPLKTVQALLRVFQDSEDDVCITTEENQVFFQGRVGLINALVVSNIIDGSYPAYENIIPKDFTVSFLVNKSNLVERIRAGSIFSSDSKTIKIDIVDNSMVISSKDTRTGDFDASLPITIQEQKEGEDTEGVSRLLNYQYVLDGLSNIQDKEIVVRVSNGPLFLQGSSVQDYLYLLMPINPNNT